MSSLFHIMDFMWRYVGSTGLLERLVEEPPLGNLAVTCHREESASHHVMVKVLRTHEVEEPPRAFWRHPVTLRRVFRTLLRLCADAPMCSAYSVCSVQCMQCIQCMQCMQCIQYILCTIYHILYSIYYILNTIYYILHTIY